jgi:hypothetical protein
MNRLKESDESLRSYISKGVDQGKRIQLDKHKKPYIRKIEQISRYNVWLVDGDDITETPFRGIGLDHPFWHTLILRQPIVTPPRIVGP